MGLIGLQNEGGNVTIKLDYTSYLTFLGHPLEAFCIDDVVYTLFLTCAIFELSLRACDSIFSKLFDR